MCSASDLLRYYAHVICFSGIQLSQRVLVINQLNAQVLFYNKFIICLYMFRAPCAHHQEVKLYYTASGIITPVVGSSNIDTIAPPPKTI